jgi:cytochrome c peroxidase
VRLLYVILLPALLLTIFKACDPKEMPEPGEPGNGNGNGNGDTTYQPRPYEINIPPRFPQMPIPEDNPMTYEGVDLGRMLFYDPILSGDSTQSCASCHNQQFAFSDNGKRFSVGIQGLEGDRTSMPIINAGWMDRLFWDGRVSTLEEQVKDPILNPLEMHLGSMEIAIERLSRHPDYPELFYKAFVEDEIKEEHIFKAIAQFMRIMNSGNSKYDRYLLGQTSLTEQEANGEYLFFAPFGEGGDCLHCHIGALMTTNLFANNGLDSVFEDIGLKGVTGLSSDLGRFKIPTLRNIELTAPYMHDGRFETLEEVLSHYNSGGIVSETIDPFMMGAGKGGLNLSHQDKQDIIAFLKTLTDDSFINNPELSNPFE